MLSKSFKICSPKRFDIYIEDIKLSDNNCIVKIDKACVCKADLRYYLGERDDKILGLKYPMSLIHEAIGTVVKDSTQKFEVGSRVVLVPNLNFKEKCCQCMNKICNLNNLGENYCKYSKFASSNYDGFSKEYIVYPSENLIRYPSDIENEAVFLELISVAYAVYRRIKFNDKNKIMLFGDGILGYIICCLLKKLTKCKVYIVGNHNEKLIKFPADKKILFKEINNCRLDFDIGIECVGGNNSESAINKLINNILPGGKILLTGVSEHNIPINTRHILEKGLSLYGITRSNIKDFQKAIEMLTDIEFRKDIKKLIINEVIINNINDFYEVFENELENKFLGKNVMKFNF